MKKYKKAVSLLFLLGFILPLLLIKPVKAAELNNNIILLMDVSKSMKQTDPNRFSIMAASMLIDSTYDNTNISIITFGDMARFKLNIENKPSKEALKKELLNTKFDNDYTDLKAGIKEALSELSKVQGDKSIILFSDGKEDPKGGITKEYTDELSSLIEKAHSQGVKMNCIALSDLADKEALKNIAYKTEGQFYYSNSASQLFNLFSRLLGSINDLYTVKEYEISNESTSEIKLSSFIEEAVIKIASFDNRAPLVDIKENDKELSASKLGDGYKIYNIKNMEDNIINISSRDKGKYLVIVQVKSKVKLKIKDLDKSFSIPKEVPVNVNMSLVLNKDIIGLHMDKVEEGIREPINKDINGFAFTFKKAKTGEYEILITAYDGEGRIIAVNNLIINVTDNPPFYYRNKVPSEMIVGEAYKIELKQLNEDKVINPSGEIIVDYGDKYEKFPLKIVDNILVSEITLHRLKEVRLTACINGVFNNDNFSYLLPYSKVQAVKKPLSKFDYYYEHFKIPIYIILILSLGDLIIIIFGKHHYKSYRYYSITKELTYRFSSTGNNYFLTVTLSPQKNIQYLNLKENKIEVEDEGSNEIGYLRLNLPKGNRIVQGLKYFLYKDKAFYIEYYPSMEQQVYKEEEQISSSLLFEGNIKIIIKLKKDQVTIYS